MQTDRARTLCFTGHRPQRLPWGFSETDSRHLKLICTLQAEIDRSVSDGYRHFLSGGALGVDMWAAELVLALKAEHPEIALHMVLPCGGQEHRWNEAFRRRYYDLLAKADDMLVLQEHYVKGCMAQRNRYLVEHAARIIGVYDGSPAGGTMQTLNMAKQQGLDIIMIQP